MQSVCQKEIVQIYCIQFNKIETISGLSTVTSIQFSYNLTDNPFGHVFFLEEKTKLMWILSTIIAAGLILLTVLTMVAITHVIRIRCNQVCMCGSKFTAELTWSDF